METQVKTSKLKLSIIVPVFNVEQYLECCLDSLLEQTVEGGYEIICVDDGSNDSSYSILMSYAERFPTTVKVFKKTNGGVSNARNFGIEQATGKYITFVDSDDYILPNSIGKVIEFLDNENALAALMSDSIRVDEHSNFSNDLKLLNLSYEFKNIATTTCWSLIVSRDLVVDNGVRFNEKMSFGEDTLFVEACQRYYWNRNIFVQGAYYCYRKRGSSAMSTATHHKKLSCQMYGLDERKNILFGLSCDENASSELKKLFEIRIDACTVNILFYALYTGEYFIPELKKRNLYPYPIQWGLLKGCRGLKGFIVNILKLLFSIEIIYKFVFLIFKFVKK